MNASQARLLRKLTRLAAAGRLIAAKLFTPTPWRSGWMYEHEGRAVLDVLPRGNARKPPRRPVHIPELPIMSMRPQPVSKHAQQKHRYGRFGKQGQATVECKQVFLAETSELGNILAHQRRLDRQARERGQQEAAS